MTGIVLAMEDREETSIETKPETEKTPVEETKPEAPVTPEEKTETETVKEEKPEQPEQPEEKKKEEERKTYQQAVQKHRYAGGADGTGGERLLHVSDASEGRKIPERDPADGTG